MYKSNQELKQEVIETKQWCVNIVNQLVNKELEIDDQLSEVIKIIKDNDLSKKVIDLMDYEGKCPYHDKVYETMIREQGTMIDQITTIKKEKEDIIDHILSDKKYPQDV
jgi:hypothetical protein